MEVSSGILKTAEAAEYLGLAQVTLETWRLKGKGPAFSQPWAGGPVRYRKTDLDAWLEANKRQSTSEHQAPQDAA